MKIKKSNGYTIERLQMEFDSIKYWVFRLKHESTALARRNRCKVYKIYG